MSCFSQHSLCKVVIVIFFVFWGNYCYGGAWEDAQGMVGGYVPDVPMPTAPKIDETYKDNSSLNSWEDEQARLARAEARAAAREERARRRAEERRKREERRRMQQLQRHKPNSSAISSPGSSSTSSFWPAGLPPKRTWAPSQPSSRKNKIDKTVQPGKESEKLAEIKLTAAALRKKANLSPDEQQFLEYLDSLARGIWKKLVMDKKLTPAQRLKYQVPLPVANGSELRITRGQIRESENTLLPKENVFMPFKETFNNSAVAATEQGGEYLVTKLLPEAPLYGAFGSSKEHYENLLGIGKIAWSLCAQKDLPSAIAETIDFFVGKIAYPQAAFTVEVGRIVATMNFQAFETFAKNAMVAAGNSEFDVQSFWKEMEAEMNVVQKGVLNWIGGRNDD